MLLTGETIQREILENKWRPAGKRVLLEAIWEVDALQSPIMAGTVAQMTKRAGDAIAFRVLGIGPMVPPAFGLQVGQVVTHNSAAGDPMDHTDEACPFWTVDYEDITGIRDADT